MCMADIMSRRSAGDGAFSAAPAAGSALAGAAFAVAHCNFHLRGEESDGDAALVREWAEAAGLPFYCTDFDTAAYASEHGLSVEMAARELRYGWFAELCRTHGFDAVAVAHNADDNAETMLLNLVRGTGSRGLCGMKAEGVVPGAPDVRLLRPLLGMSRADICDYAASHGVQWREDRTNSDIAFKRNRIRHEVMPVMESLNPAFLRTLAREGQVFSREYEALTAFAQGFAGRFLKDGRIALAGFSDAPGWEYGLYRLTEECELPWDVFEALRSFVAGGEFVSGKEFRGAAGRVVSASDALVVETFRGAAEGEVFLIPGVGEYEVGGFMVRVERFVRPEGFELRQTRGVLVFDARAMAFPLRLRRWQDGDWMRPLGLRGSKKLSDLFVDLKYSLVDKARALVMELDGAHVGALLGERIDDSLKVGPSTTEIVRISVTPSPKGA